MSDIFIQLAKADFPGRTVAYTGSAGNTATWNPGPEVVMVWTSTAAYVEVGEGVTATTASTPIPANTIIYLKIPKGDGAPWRVSAIQVAAGGDVYTKPVNPYR